MVRLGGGKVKKKENGMEEKIKNRKNRGIRGFRPFLDRRVVAGKEITGGNSP